MFMILHNFIMRYNIWNAYEQYITTMYPTLGYKLQKNIVSCTHAVTTIIWTILYNFRDINLLLLSLILSNLYYIHDLKNHVNTDTMSYIMYLHHVLTCILLTLGFLFEHPDLSLIFLFIELSNLPLYFTQIVLHSPHQQYWKPYFKWCVLTECIFFFLFRCVAVAPLLFVSQTRLVFYLLIFVYMAGVFWTLKLCKQLPQLFGFGA
jgi:hypothetical protein